MSLSAAPWTSEERGEAPLVSQMEEPLAAALLESPAAATVVESARIVRAAKNFIVVVILYGVRYSVNVRRIDLGDLLDGGTS